MNSLDLPVLYERLNEVFATLNNGRLPPELALKMWGHTLREFPLPDIVDVLTGWMKTAIKVPSPAEVYKACALRRGARLEQTSAADNSRAESQALHQRCPVFAAKLHALTADLTASDRPKMEPKEWASMILDRFLADRKNANGTPVSYIQIDFACQALRISTKEAYKSRDRQRAGDVA